MERKRKLIISLGISLVLIIALNFVIISRVNANFVEVLIFKKDMLKGKVIESKDITNIQIKKNKENEGLLKTVDKNNIVGKILLEDVNKGDLVSENKFTTKEEALEQVEDINYISIPISNLSYAACNKLSKGDKIALYYTAKAKDVSNAIKDKKRLYSNNVPEGEVTCILFEDVEVMSLHDNTGKEVKEGAVTDILIRLKKEDVMLVSNLKKQGTFDIVLN